MTVLYVTYRKVTKHDTVTLIFVIPCTSRFNILNVDLASDGYIFLISEN